MIHFCLWQPVLKSIRPFKWVLQWWHLSQTTLCHKTNNLQVKMEQKNLSQLTFVKSQFFTEMEMKIKLQSKIKLNEKIQLKLNGNWREICNRNRNEMRPKLKWKWSPKWSGHKSKKWNWNEHEKSHNTARAQVVCEV